MKHRVLSLILALSAFVCVLTGCSDGDTAIRFAPSQYLREYEGHHVFSSGSEASSSASAYETPVESTSSTKETSGSSASAYETPVESTSSTKEASGSSESAYETPVESTSSTKETSSASVEPVESQISVPASSDISAPEEPKPSAPETISDIDNETFIQYTSVADVYKPKYSTQYVYLYNFNTALSNGYGENDELIYAEANYGLTGKLDGRKLTAKIYDHTGSMEVTTTYVDCCDKCDSSKKDVVFTNDTFTMDTSSLHNGLYRVIAGFADKDKKVRYAKINFYINGDETWLCQTETISAKTSRAYMQRRKDLLKILDDGNVTPENSVSLTNVWYPCYDFDEKSRCDTQRWADISNEICDKNWSKDHKVFAIQDWIRNNIAYDDYVVEIGMSRAMYNDCDYAGTYSVYKTSAGVCFDFAHIFAIMCREQNIPAITIGSEDINHVWNVVYINNRWIEYDACTQEKYHVDKNFNKTKGNDYDDPYQGIYQINPWWYQDQLPDDTTANQYWQYNSYDIY